MLTHERLKELLDYDPATGEFTWRINRGRTAKAGGRAGTRTRKGYRQLIAEKQPYLEHRLAWFYVHGEWPAAQVDHKNGERACNPINNLREATGAQNARNRKPDTGSCSGVRGVTKRGKKWHARITARGNEYHIGFYSSKLAAEVARGQAVALLHGKFARY